VFVVPFLGLLNKTTKRTPFWWAVRDHHHDGMWIERHVLVMPSLNRTRCDRLPEIGVTLGFLGVSLAVQGFLAKYPPIKVTDALAGGEATALTRRRVAQRPASAPRPGRSCLQSSFTRDR